METIEKIYDVKKLKAEIKVLAGYQIFLKNQRKTVKLQGKREMEPWWATSKHQENRGKLAIMYVAYGVMRGKNLEEQLNAHVSKKDEYVFGSAKTKVETLINNYKIEQEAAA